MQAQYHTVQKPPEKTRILFLLDASGSMLAPWDGKVRMNVAKKLLTDLVDSLQVNKNLQLALRVYGHQSPVREKNCKDSKLEVPFKANNHQVIKDKIKQISPKGNTPIAYSLEQAANDFPIDENYRNVLILITDGEESCDGDPCAISTALQKKKIFLKPLIIGLGMDESFAESFNCVGQFLEADNINKLKQSFNSALKRSLNKTTVSVELLDDKNKPTETDLNVTFVNNVTGDAMYEFIHYRDGLGRPDSVEIDGVVSYDLIVNTIPPVYKKNIKIEAGEHNVISVSSPQGILEVNQKNHTDYKGGIKTLVYHKGKMINTQNITEKEKYLIGSYNVEVLTLPKTVYNNVKIDHAKLTKIDVPPPGMVHFSSAAPGIGNIYAVGPNGKQEWVYNLNPNITRASIAIQPGNYKVVFRARNAMGSKYTYIKSFTVQSGSNININLTSR